MKKIHYIILSFITCFSSCYTDVDLDKYKPEPKILLNSVISPDDFIMASVSRTIFFTEIGQEDLGISDADVDLYINNELLERMVWEENPNLANQGIYKSTVKPQIGDLVKIVVSSSFGEAWAEDRVPAPIAIQDIKLTHRTFIDPNSIHILPDGTIKNQRKTEIKYHITFTDNAQEKNYYCIKIGSVSGNLDYSLDPVFRAQQSFEDGTVNKLIEGQGGRTFSDEIINGETYTMVIRETEIAFMLGLGEYAPRTIHLYAISEPYYNYLTALLNYSDNSITKDLEDIGLSEPTPFYSNINGGVGIVGSVKNEFKLIDLRTIIPENWE